MLARRPEYFNSKLQVKNGQTLSYYSYGKFITSETIYTTPFQVLAAVILLIARILVLTACGAE
jgi:hypothetical protein